MLAQVSVYIRVDQLERLRREGNQSDTIRRALDALWEKEAEGESE